MTTAATMPPVAASPARETQPAKRKIARESSAQAQLEAARKQVQAAKAAEARALARVEEEARRARIAQGRSCVAALVERLDPSAREMVVAQLLGVARENETVNVQEWLTSLEAH